MMSLSTSRQNIHPVSSGGVFIAFNPPASAFTQHLLVSPVLPSDPWVHPKTLATPVTDQASSKTRICTELTKIPHLGDVIIPSQILKSRAQDVCYTKQP